MKASILNKQFYKDKRVFVTGHTGFKGAWLTLILNTLCAESMGYALLPAEGSLFEKINGDKLINSVIGDIRDFNFLKHTISEFQPEIVIHLAAYGFVRECFENPRLSYETNVMGTVNLLESIRECKSVRNVLLVSSDKVYNNIGDASVYVENDHLGGIDPYSSSKTCVEFISEAYKMSYLQTVDKCIGISTVRASNVLGGGDHVKSRLIPTILQSFKDGLSVKIRNPHQTRPWQYVLDALNGYLTICRFMFIDQKKYSTQWNIGPRPDGIRNVLWVLQKMHEYYENNGSYVLSKKTNVKESQTLGLDITKALTLLDWQPEISCEKSLYYVVDFFKKQINNIPEIKICTDQVNEFYSIKN